MLNLTQFLPDGGIGVVSQLVHYTVHEIYGVFYVLLASTLHVQRCGTCHSFHVGAARLCACSSQSCEYLVKYNVCLKKCGLCILHGCGLRILGHTSYYADMVQN